MESRDRLADYVLSAIGCLTDKFGKAVLRLLMLSLLLVACSSAASRAGVNSSNEAPADLQKADFQPLLADTARIAQKAGAGELKLVALGHGVAGDAVEGLVYLPRGACGLFYARAGSGVGDIDLYAFGDDGTEYGADEAPDDLPTLLFCADTSQRLLLSARVAQGQGLVALGMHQVSASRLDQVAQAVGVREEAATDEATHPWNELEELVAQHRRSLGGDWTELRRVALPVDARLATRFDLNVPAQRCVDLLLLPEDGYLDLSLELLDDDGRLMLRGHKLGERRYMVLCNEGRGVSLSLNIRPQVGQGIALLLVSATSDKESQLSLHDSVPVHVLGNSPEREFKNLRALFSKLGASFSIQAERGEIISRRFSGGSCEAMLLQAESGTHRFHVRAWSTKGLLLSEKREYEGNVFFVCSEEAYRVDFESADAGSVKVQPLSLLDPPALLLKHPLAASRLLQRMLFRGLPFTQSSLSQLDSFSAPLNQLVQEPLGVGSEQCYELLVALESQAANLELRVRESDGLARMQGALGRGSAHLSLCGSKDSKPLTLELISSSEATEGIMLLLPLTEDKR